MRLYPIDVTRGLAGTVSSSAILFTRAWRQNPTGSSGVDPLTSVVLARGDDEAARRGLRNSCIPREDFEPRGWGPPNEFSAGEESQSVPDAGAVFDSQIGQVGPVEPTGSGPRR